MSRGTVIPSMRPTFVVDDRPELPLIVKVVEPTLKSGKLLTFDVNPELKLS